MKWVSVAPEQALGHILCHNLADAQGRKALHKGTRIGEQEVAQLQTLGLREVAVVMLEPSDVHENAAAERLTRACIGEGVSASDAGGGRTNLLARQAGIVKIQREALRQINALDGLTIATLRHNSLIPANKIAATIKVIPYAVPEATIQRAERIGLGAQGVVAIRPLLAQTIGVILTGSASARERVSKAFAPAIRSRIEALGSTMLNVIYVPHESRAIAEALHEVRTAGTDMCIIAGETSIMDVADVTPSGIAQAGGRIEHYGAPVEPGNLLLLAYLDQWPVIGAPGCVRSRDLNVVDLILPRLVAGEHLQRDDIIELADGGLLL